jgi:hypothetical protein
MSVDVAMSEMKDSPSERVARLTADRDEIKYLLPAEEADGFVRSMTVLLSPHRHHVAAPGDPPSRGQYATTVYFDTASMDLYRAAVRATTHIKVRAREYYDEHSTPTAGATSGPHASISGHVVWIELKVRDGQRSRKRRVCVPKLDVERFLAGPHLDLALLELQAGGGDPIGATASPAEHMRACWRTPLRASCVVNYRRSCWQDGGAALRITLDREVCAFAPPADLWSRRRVLTKEALGQPVFEEPFCVLEVKSRGQLPSWLGQVVGKHGATHADYSKFVIASRAVHGPFQ